MTPYDWAVLIIAVLLVVRGWRRGAVRTAIDGALLLVGTVIVFRVSPVVGAIVSGMANVPDEVGRVIAGVIVFTGLVVGSFVLGGLVASALRVVPGATGLDHLAGSFVGLAISALVVVVGTTLLSAAPAPAAVRRSIDTAIDRSAVGSAIVDPDGRIQPAVTVASGERLFGAVIAVRDAVGERLMAGTIPVPFPAPDDEVLAPSQRVAQVVFDRLNVERIGAGADPLAWSPDLAVVAVSRATDVYRSGVLSVDDDLADALAVAGVPGTRHTDLVVMAASEDGIVEAILAAPAYEAAVTDPGFVKAGIGVVDGPYGKIAVQVLSG